MAHQRNAYNRTTAHGDNDHIFGDNRSSWGIGDWYWGDDASTSITIPTNKHLNKTVHSHDCSGAALSRTTIPGIGWSKWQPSDDDFDRYTCTDPMPSNRETLSSSSPIVTTIAPSLQTNVTSNVTPFNEYNDDAVPYTIASSSSSWSYSNS